MSELPKMDQVFGIIIIGAELLSAKRKDKHFEHAVEALSARGLSLSWCKIIGDDKALIADTLRQSLPTQDIVFCFGGIGVTPDDLTRQAAAEAAGVALYRHPEAVAEMEARYGADTYPRRVLMADLPETSTIIPNPYNRIAGFSLGSHHFLPGFPVMAWPMMDWLLDTKYADCRPQEFPTEAVLVVFDAVEGELLDVMNDFVQRFPQVRFSCLPEIGAQRRLELGVRGGSNHVVPAMGDLSQRLQALGYRIELNSVK